jgi:addiction module HigA family antidote
MLAQDFLPDYNLSAAALAEAAGVSRQTMNELLRGRRGVSAPMALRLGRLFGTTPEFWLDAQRAVDLWDAAEAAAGDLARIRPLSAHMTR